MKQNNKNNEKLEKISLFLNDLKKIVEIDNFTSELVIKNNKYNLFINLIENNIEKEKIENLLFDYFDLNSFLGPFYNEFLAQYSIMINL